jgi:hypothetical protein
VHHAIEYLEGRGAEGVLIEGTTALDFLSPTVSVMVATDPGKKWKDVALRRVVSTDIVLRNLTPGQVGPIAAPPEFYSASPLDCDLWRHDDSGTQTYQRRLVEFVTSQVRA